MTRVVVSLAGPLKSSSATGDTNPYRSPAPAAEVHAPPDVAAHSSHHRLPLFVRRAAQRGHRVLVHLVRPGLRARRGTGIRANGRRNRPADGERHAGGRTWNGSP